MVARGRATLAVVACLLLLLAPGAVAADGDPLRAEQWALDRIDAAGAWEHARGQGAVVAVLDTGVQPSHPELRDRLLRDGDGRVVGADLVDDGGAWPGDPHGHGTLVAGIVAATAGNGEGIAGVAPRASIMPVRVLDADGGGSSRTVDEGIRWAVDNGADVINLSLEAVGGEDGRRRPGASDDAVRYAWERGVPIVVASGNSGGQVSDYPADSPVLLVGATDREDRPTAFSAGGRRDAVLAPGVEILSSWCRPPEADGCAPDHHGYGLAEGTSFAAPHVTGLVALLVSAGHDGPEAVRRIRASVEPVGDGDWGLGRIDAAAALGDGIAPEPEASRTAAADADRAEPTEQPEPQEADAAQPGPEVEPVPEPAAEEPAEDDAAAAPDADTEPPATGQAEQPADPPVALEPAPRTAAEPAPPSRAPGEAWLGAAATALLLATIAAWSAVARRLL